MRILISFLLLTTSLHSSIAQWQFQSYQNIPLNNQTPVQRFPWAGGLNGVQYSQMDLNNDGELDIVAYDRSSKRTICFLKNNNSYNYAPGYESYFPEEIVNFLILKDYDQDGKADLFTAGNLGIAVYRNISIGNTPRWEKVSDFITYESLSGNTINLQTSFNDYPYIGDIDGDGDLDIFNFNFSGIESKIVFYKNESIENTGNAGIDDYRVEDNYWGEIEDCACNHFAFGGEPCNSNFGRQAKERGHAGGKSVLIHDFNGDGTLDLVTSHEECNELYAFKDSEVSGISPVYNSFSTIFPNAENPAAFNFYPNTMLLDLSGNGSNDIIISPNVEANLGNPVNFKASNWLYEATATGYELKTKSFLQEDMIDWGFQASPAFTDYDSDGDLDLFVAYTNLDENENLFSSIAHYENIGSANNPAFELLTDNFLNIQSVGMANMVMQWKDIDGDGLQDLMIQGTINNSNQLFFIYNNNGSLILNNREVITDANIGFGFSVHLADVTGTEEVDLLVGKSSGGLILYENTGSGRNPSFTQVDPQYLNIGDNFFRSALKVYVDDLDNDGKADLIASDQSGIFRVFSDIQNNTGESDSLVLNNPLSNSFEAYNFGGRNLITSARLFNDDYPSLILGSISGGLRVIRNVQEFPVVDSPNNKTFIVFPNPNTSRILQINTNENISISMSNLRGQRVIEAFPYAANSGNSIDLTGLSQGVYIVTATFRDGQQISRKIILE